MCRYTYYGWIYRSYIIATGLYGLSARIILSLHCKLIV